MTINNRRSIKPRFRSVATNSTLVQTRDAFSTSHAKAMATIATETELFDKEYQSIQAEIATMRNLIRL